MVSAATLTTCFLTIPQFPQTTSIPGNWQTFLTYAYSPANTNWVGGTLCGVSQRKYPATSISGSPYLPTPVKCTFPTGPASKPYAITPYIQHKPIGLLYTTRTACDPIPATALNAAKFSIRCPSIIGPNLYLGPNTFSFIGPGVKGMPTIANHVFYVTSAHSTTKYVANPTLAKTNLIPTTTETVSTTIYTTFTRSTYTKIVTTYEGTMTLTCTITASIPSGVQARAAVTVQPRIPSNVVPLDFVPPEQENYDVPAVTNEDLDLHSGNGTTEYVESWMVKNEGKEKVAVEQDDGMRELIKRAPSIGKPDFRYPPTPVATVFVSSLITTTYTCLKQYQSVITPPLVTRTTTFHWWTGTTITVQPTVG